ncbi:MAG: (Fe-S)-binding protein [Promethearchaeota archaeon]
MSKQLEEYHEMVYHCTKCFNCIYINPYFIKNEDRYYGCPSGFYYKYDAFFSGGRMEIARGLIEGELSITEKLAEIFYACTLCGLCESNCEFLIELKPTEVFESMRRELIKEGFTRPEHDAFSKSIMENHNPYQEKHDTRTKWLENLGIDIKPEAEILYFVGCTSSYRTEKIAEATAKIFKKLGLDFTISPDEWCCGSPLLRTGRYNQAISLMKHNRDLIEKLNAKKVVFSCAGCFRAFKTDYQKELGNLGVEILHVSQLLNKLHDEGKIKLKEKKSIITYHDPCHMGRHEKVYDEPRNMIKAVPGTELDEMDRITMNAWCCGAGGGVKSAFKDFALESSKERIREAELTNAEILMSCCPFCKLNLEDAAQATNSKLKVMDLTEYLDECLE